MVSKTINNSAYLQSGYVLDGTYTTLTIGAAGRIGGGGLASGGSKSYTIANLGQIVGGYDGVFLRGGGFITNSGIHALISGGYDGVAMDKLGTVANSGTVLGTGADSTGVYLALGGRVTNIGTAALIDGYRYGVKIRAAAGTIVNGGTIQAAFGAAVQLNAGGVVNNAGSTSLIIANLSGIDGNGAPATVTNAGLIEAATAVVLHAGGSVNNQAGATVYGTGNAIVAYGKPLTVNNTGTVIAGNLGVLASNGGVVTNVKSGLVEGAAGGVRIAAQVGTVTNSGTIVETGATPATAAIYLAAGGNVSNLVGGLITGYTGILALGGTATVANAGRIVATGTGSQKRADGVFMFAGGSVSNTIRAAVIDGSLHGISSQNGAATVSNLGTIKGGATGIYVTAGALVTNGAGALITTTGTYGRGILVHSGVGTVVNAGRVIDTTGGLQAGIEFYAGGSVTNTASGLIKAVQAGIATLNATVTNSGTVIVTTTSSSGAGILIGGGVLTNNAGGFIEGYTGVKLANVAGSLVNGGTIVSTGTTSSGAGVMLLAGGEVINGALISAQYLGIYGKAVPATVTNTGTVTAVTGGGVVLHDGGAVDNAASGVIDGLIAGVVIHNFGTVSYGVSLRNAGQITGGLYAVALDHGTIDNLAGGLIKGGGGIEVGVFSSANGVAGFVRNAGTISALNSGTFGVKLADGSTLTNLAGGLVEGYFAAAIKGNGVVNNAGTIVSSAGVGLYLFGGTITNSASAVIQGQQNGVKFGGGTTAASGTLINFGTIESAGNAVVFSETAMLYDEAGSRFIGQVVGGGGTLHLAGANGTLSGLGTQFTGFAEVILDSGATWTASGTNTVVAGSALLTQGTLTVAGTLAINGEAFLYGPLAGTGAVTVTNGLIEFDTPLEVSVRRLSLVSSTLGLAGNSVDSGQFAEGQSMIELHNYSLSLTGAETFTGGTIEGGGFVATHGTAAAANLTITGGAAWQDFGLIKETGKIVLGDASSSGRLVVIGGGVFDIAADFGILGRGTVVNEGLLEKVASTGLSSILGLTNTGTIAALSGTLAIAGAVRGTGRGTIGTSGTLQLNALVVATQTVTFAGKTGDLVLNDPAGAGLSFAGTIAGFGGSDLIDLPTLAYAGTAPSWMQNGTAGTLTVTEGTNIAKLMLFGQYTSANFKAQTDGHGGTLITYVGGPQVASLAAPPH